MQFKSTYELKEFKLPEVYDNCPLVLLKIMVAAEGKTCTLKLQWLNAENFLVISTVCAWGQTLEVTIRLSSCPSPLPVKNVLIP
jgi:hypothetical protein